MSDMAGEELERLIITGVPGFIVLGNVSLTHCGIVLGPANITKISAWTQDWEGTVRLRVFDQEGTLRRKIWEAKLIPNNYHEGVICAEIGPGEFAVLSGVEGFQYCTVGIYFDAED